MHQRRPSASRSRSPNTHHRSSSRSPPTTQQRRLSATTDDPQTSHPTQPVPPVHITAPQTQVTARFNQVKEQLETQCKKVSRAPSHVKLLAVSKTHPPAPILEIYSHTSHRAFGENYVNELVEKALLLPKDIQWHFIGTLQSNKAKLLAPIPNLVMVESIDSVKLAQKLNTELHKVQRKHPLDVLVQVNTSEEDQKGGVEPGDDTVALVKFILESCDLLHFRGLMTIGKKLDVDNPSAAPYFQTLLDCKKLLCKSFPTQILDNDDFVLSMGMTDDYEEAIKHGSTEIRVGTAIFGQRNSPFHEPTPAPQVESSPTSQ